MRSMKRLNLSIIFIILILGFALRLYKFDAPLADWHSWRQADTSAVSRNFVNNGFDFLHPKFDDLSNVPTNGVYDNPQGYRFVEFPIYNTIHGVLFKAFGILTLEQWGRMVSIIASLSSALLIYLIVKKHSTNRAGLIAAFFFSVLPYSVYYGRVILPDPMTNFAILSGIFFFDKFLTEQRGKKWTYFTVSILFTAASLLLKPFAVFFMLPTVYLAYNAYKFGLFKKWFLWVYLILGIIPLFLWRIWMTQFPEGIPSSDWLFNGGNIRFKGAYFYWIFAERFSKLILGYFGVALFMMGLFSKVKKENLLFFLSLIASSLIYLVVIARGNVQHDYYQILILPTIAIFLGIGSDYLLSINTYNLIKYPVFIMCTFFTLFFSWYHIRDYFNINNFSIVEAGKIIDEITPKDSKIIADYNGDTTFLYQTKRKGWASQEKQLFEMVKMGANYFALANPKPSDFYFEKDYKIEYSSGILLLYNLNRAPDGSIKIP